MPIVFRMRDKKRLHTRWRLQSVVTVLTAVLLAFVAKPMRAQTGTVDHAVFDALLHAHVVNGLVDYPAFARNASFSRYLATLDTVQATLLDPQERLAFWINVYNAFTIYLVASHGETRSIRNIDKTFGVLRLKGPWSDPFVHAAGHTLTLDDVEHTMIRKEFREPRIHFALVFAALGSPPLRSEAYTGAKLDAQLEDQGRTFISQSPTKNRMERFALALSPLFTYYRADFGTTRSELGQFLAPWFGGDDRKRLEKGAFGTRETDFDWTLNSQRKGRPL